MMFEIMIAILFWIAVPVGIIWGLLRLRKKGRKVFTGLSIRSLSPIFLALSITFLAVTLLSLMRDSLSNDAVVLNILFVVFLTGLVLSYVYKSALNLGIWFVMLMAWWFAKADDAWVDVDGGDVKPFSLMLGILLIAFTSYVLGHIHRVPELFRFKDFSRVYFVIGSGILGLSLYFFSTHVGVDSLGDMLEGQTVFASTGMFFSLLVFTALLLGSVVYAAHRELLKRGEAMVILGSVIGLNVLLHSELVLTAGPESWLFGIASLTPTGLLLAAILNITLFALAIGLILWGEREHTPWKVNLGILTLGLVIITKYFDWFFSFLDKSIFFIGAGLLLLGLSYVMEKKRRSLLQEMKTETNNDQQHHE